LQENGKWTEAEQQYRQLIERHDRLGHPENPDYFALRGNLSMVLFLQGRLEEAMALLTESRARCVRSCGPEHVATLQTQHILARVLYVAGRLDESEALLRETLAIRRRVTPVHEGMGRTLLYLGRVLVEKGKLDDAEPLIREADTLFRERYRMKPELAAQSANWLGAIQLSRQNFAEAEQFLLSNPDAMLPRSAGMCLAEQRTAFGHLVPLYQAWGKPDQAAPWQQKLDALPEPQATARSQ
jgi:tetratricopeptide (TPR) repeat protein